MHKRSLTISLTSCLLAGIAFAATQWTLEPKQSQLTFVGTQAGAQFEGSFEKFTADIRFDAKDLAGSRFEVHIDPASVNTKDAERDGIIKGPDLFAVEQYPTATYIAERFTDRGSGQYVAAGKLTLRGVTRDVPVNFTFEAKADGAWLKGESPIRRLDFGVGQGDWRDTEAVANEVRVRFALRLTP
jgi:polyisoprenoid-binding protein YceI